MSSQHLSFILFRKERNGRSTNGIYYVSKCSNIGQVLFEEDVSLQRDFHSKESAAADSCCREFFNFMEFCNCDFKVGSRRKEEWVIQYIYIYSSNVPAYNRLFSFKMIHRPDSRRINWKYFWNIAFQILQVTVIVSIYFFFPTFCFPRNFKREREENIDWTFYERPFDHFYSRVKVKNIGCVNYRSIPLHKRLHKIGRNRRISRIKKFWTTILNKSQNLKMELLKITRLKNLSL